MKQLRSAGVETPVVTVDGNDSLAARRLGRQRGRTASCSRPRRSRPRAAAAAKFFTDYEKTMGKKPETNTVEAMGRDNVYAFVEAAAAAKSTDPDAVLDAVNGFKDKEFVTGKLTMSADQPVPEKDVFLVKVERQGLHVRQAVPAEVRPGAVTAAADTPMLDVRGLEVRYGPIVAAQDVHAAGRPRRDRRVAGRERRRQVELLNAVAGLVPAAAGRGHARRRARSQRRAPERIVRHGVALAPEGRRVFPRLTRRAATCGSAPRSSADARRAERGARARARPVPDPARAARPERGHALGRPAADARDRPRR